MSEDIDQLRTLLAEARAAQHKLACGARTVRVRTETWETMYAPETISGLNAYISSLQMRLDRATGRRSIQRNATVGL